MTKTRAAGSGQTIEAEFAESRLGDRRLDLRLRRLGTMAATDPEASFPVAAGNDSELEATYRFLRNASVRGGAILEPHVRATVGRCGGKPVVVAHDTTEFNFGKSSRQDLGRVGRGQSFGFYGHFALAIRPSAGREPLGVLGLRIHRRRGGKGRRGHRVLQADPTNEGRRWLALVEQVEAELPPTQPRIHVMDREGDAYALMVDLVGRGSRFVIRMAQDSRRIVGRSEVRVGEALRTAPVLAEREVPILERRRSTMPSYRKHFPERHARVARLQISSDAVTVIRPNSSSHCPVPEIRLNVVRVFESDPPPGEPAIEWRLWTTEPVGTAEQVLAVVDAYRCRWRIEEYFKALKSGCAIERRQLETYHGLANTLCLYAPIAWRLLLLRTLARSNESCAATEALSPTQITCLRGALRKQGRPDLPREPTVRDAMLGIAGLGGHIKNNGEPGWIVLGRGLDKLLTIELGYVLAQEQGEM